MIVESKSENLSNKKVTHPDLPIRAQLGRDYVHTSNNRLSAQAKDAVGLL